MKNRSALKLLLLFSLTTAVVAFQNCGGSPGGGATTSAPQILMRGLIITPAVANLSAYQSQKIIVTGGYAPYTFVMAQGPGSVDYNTGVYSATALSGTAIINIMDATGQQGTATFNVTGSSTGTTTPTTFATTTNCSIMMTEPNTAYQDTSATGIGATMGYESIADPSSCASWCGQQNAGYCEWSPNEGTPVCVAWAVGAAVTQYSSSWATYSGACQ